MVTGTGGAVRAGSTPHPGAGEQERYVRANEDGGNVSTAAARAAAGLPARSRTSTTLVVYAHASDKKTGRPGEAG